ncbi:MAG: 23S rRNA (uracil(1939)-C(5))-methyltransferase RlmD [Acholeplasma sp.]|jgi:23S rRNA (uracil1939-C5)-methyltransferase|nr:MAG: 23S rRNA (uracil(1939)-C(5))-methyltransferase RlmD [Acholeplasma sp.]
MNEFIKIGDTLNVDVKRMGINGEGIAYYQKLAIFIDHALPGEEVKVNIKEVLENRAIGELVEVRKPSPDRVEPFCPIYHQCGGCQTQHIAYEAMLEQKREMIIRSFERYAGIEFTHKQVKKTLGAEHPTYYRNKASLPVQRIKNKNRFGMYQKNSNRFIAIDGCPIQNEEINRILNTIILLMAKHQMDAFDPKKREGYVRALVVRVAEGTKEAQVTFVMLKKSNRIEAVVRDLVHKEPTVKSVHQTLHPDMKKMGFFGEALELIYGKETIEEELNGQKYQLKPEAFFQLNTPQAHKFYLEMKRLAQLKSHEIAIDAYAGIAPVSHYIHKDCRSVYAIEVDPSSCESAKLSLEKNGITNVTVLQSDFKRALSGLKEKKIDVMFFDPPRVGLGSETIELILQNKPKRLIYGSCNPSTLAKDIFELSKDYTLIETVPIDMFPYTSLVESVSLLEKKSS